MKMPVLYSFLSSMSGEWGRVNGTAEDQGWGECGTAEPLNVAWWRRCFFSLHNGEAFPFYVPFYVSVFSENSVSDLFCCVFNCLFESLKRKFSAAVLLSCLNWALHWLWNRFIFNLQHQSAVVLALCTLTVKPQYDWSVHRWKGKPINWMILAWLPIVLCNGSSQAFKCIFGRILHYIVYGNRNF